MTVVSVSIIHQPSPLCLIGLLKSSYFFHPWESIHLKQTNRSSALTPHGALFLTSAAIARRNVRRSLSQRGTSSPSWKKVREGSSSVSLSFDHTSLVLFLPSSFRFDFFLSVSDLVRLLWLMTKKRRALRAPVRYVFCFRAASFTTGYETWKRFERRTSRPSCQLVRGVTRPQQMNSAPVRVSPASSFRPSARSREMTTIGPT